MDALPNHRRAIDIKTKLMIIKPHEERSKVQTISSSMGLAYSATSTTLKDKDKVENTKTTWGYNAVITRVLIGLIHEMEKLLIIWIDGQIGIRMPMSLTLLQNKAISIFSTL